MTTTIRLGEVARLFATRDAGRRIRERIQALQPGESVMIDWTGVEAITAGFGDELIGKLAASSPDLEVRSTGMCPEVWETLELVRKRRRLPCPDCYGAGVIYAGTLGSAGEPCPRGCERAPLAILLDPDAPF